jgi:hypothetical protein
MTNSTLQSRALQLLQKSRQAFRLYSRPDRSQSGASTFHSSSHTSHGKESGEPQELQRQEWRNVNAELIRTLGRILDATSTKHLAQELHGLRESFLMRYRESQASLRQQQEALIASAERGDFLAVPKAGYSLISLKALGQAQQAAIHELDALLGPYKSNVGEEKTPESRVAETPKATAKIIPLRRVATKYS